VPPRPASGIVELAHAQASDDGSVLLATVGQSNSAFKSPKGLSQVQLEYVWLKYDGSKYVETRRIYTRAHNAIEGTESAVTESTRDPLLVVNQFRSLTLNPTTGALERHYSAAAISYFLIRNGDGNFFALRAPMNSGVGVLLDRKRGLLRYGEKWFDLKVLVGTFDDLLSLSEVSRAQ
jgi:hypothetical protein